MSISRYTYNIELVVDFEFGNFRGGEESGVVVDRRLIDAVVIVGEKVEEVQVPEF